MAKNNTELQILENYRIALLNMENMSEIKSVLEGYGYNDKKVEEGRNLFQVAKEKYNTNKEEKDKERTSYANYSNLYKVTMKNYTNHRKIAKVALMQHKDLWSLFKINGTLPTNYLEVMEYAKTFYKQSKSNEEISHLFDMFKITNNEIDTQLENLAQIEDLKAEYGKRKGISQDATQQKNKAFSELSQWMRVFYSVSKIAFSDRAQLLESLMKVVRN